jgi:hypothetical protein
MNVKRSCPAAGGAQPSQQDGPPNRTAGRQQDGPPNKLAGKRAGKKMKTGIPDSACSCAGVQLNAPTPPPSACALHADRSAGHDGRLPAVCVEGMANADTGLVTSKR